MIRTVVSGTGIPVRGNDIDTDRIIPARYLKCTTFDDLGNQAFYDERFDSDGKSKGHAFDNKNFNGGSILIVNKNFGCGSSREHAPQALVRFGIKAIIGESFAEIFAGNCLTLGVPLVTMNQQDVEKLQTSVKENPAQNIIVDVKNKKVNYAGESIEVGISNADHQSLVKGSWDSTAVLLKNSELVKTIINELPYINNFS